MSNKIDFERIVVVEKPARVRFLFSKNDIVEGFRVLYLWYGLLTTNKSGNCKYYVVECVKCGEIRYVTEDRLRKTKKCRKCYLFNVGDTIEKENGILIIQSKIRYSNSKNGVATRRGYTYKCSNCGNENIPISESELVKSKYCCPFCSGVKPKVSPGYNDLKTTEPWVIPFLNDKDDATRYTRHSGKRIVVKCPRCGLEKDMTVRKLVDQGLSCNRCGDKRPLGEKVVYSILSSLNIRFIYQRSTDWSDGRIYDFQVPDFNLIIETHGLQHYKETCHFKNRTLSEEQENDAYKHELAIQNNVKNYVVIDCSKSDVRNIIKQIRESELFNILDISFEDVDWNDIVSYVLTSNAINICALYESGMSQKEISEKTKLNINTISRYICTYLNPLSQI